ncbi:MAG: molybdopterin-dependent oxidoreductase [Nitrospirae bacterium]|nr:molybdopterin-dependent oxidoreductase [Nitrospirota bacterium]
MSNSVFSICGMCSVRCPIRVETGNSKVVWIEGNPNVPGINGRLCAKGGAGISFEYDSERLQYPMIRRGKRGAGDWRRATWDDALEYITFKLMNIKDKYGQRATAISDRGGPFTDLTKGFIRALGSPNYFNHDDT